MVLFSLHEAGIGGCGVCHTLMRPTWITLRVCVRVSAYARRAVGVPYSMHRQNPHRLFITKFNSMTIIQCRDFYGILVMRVIAVKLSEYEIFGAIVPFRDNGYDRR